MSDLVAVCFKGHDTAGKVLEDLQQMQKEYIVDMEDACWVSRDAGGKLKLHQTVHLAGVGAMSGASWGGLWGLLIGLLFLNPLAGFALVRPLVPPVVLWPASCPTTASMMSLSNRSDSR